MLEFLDSVDPMALPLWAVLAFSAAMFPIGILLPCGKCCACGGCVTGALPDTITVTFSGLPTQTQGPDLMQLSIQACFGSGADARVTAPGGDPNTDKGPISAVEVTKAGSGYAKLGRVEPTVTVAGGSGIGATFTVTLAEDSDYCGLPFWGVDSIAVSDGDDYAEGDSLTFTITEGDASERAAVATVHTKHSEPTLEASAPSGSGATFSLGYTKNDDPPETWRVSSISVTDGGTGYNGGDNVTFSLGVDDAAASAAFAQIRTQHSEPTLTASVSSETGSGASVSVVLTKNSGDPETWSVTTTSIVDGGLGYAENDPVSVIVTDGEESWDSYFYAYVSSVDEDGVITAITIDYGGSYYKDDGIITGVDLFDGGAYFKDDGIPSSVSVEDGGIYYREDASEAPYVADVTVSILYQTLPSSGTGAALSAVVDDDTSSSTFGKITSVVVDDGGDDGYLAWRWLPVCVGFYNGMTVVLKRNGPFASSISSADAPCIYTHALCDNGSLNPVTFQDGVVIAARYFGPDQPIRVYLPWVFSVSSDGPPPPQFIFIADRNIEDCGNFDGTLTAEHSASGATATIDVGGDYDETYRHEGFTCTPCCRGDQEIPQELEVTISDARTLTPEEVLAEVELIDGNGTYVLVGSPVPTQAGVNWFIDSPTANINVGVISCNPGALSDDANCGTCGSRCKMFVSAVLYKTTGGTFFLRPNHLGCDNCEDVPVCVPEILGMALCESGNAGDCDEVTIST